ncbi:stringent starvation protein B [Oxalicibacterium flavum]|uniref:Stringent starvation protein B n=1 Tax=Oxalicibacterium flavum TaxID=179467 RepID=A0A8J2UMJ9_9BURK|nr:ClpXP protease specificity-enhancing factor [Oxalicibacterium flavum]GGC06073.1 stringent starvation protein B [Oxalicibacterium flavum]
MSETSTKPYLLRAIYEWCTDNGYTPYMAAVVDGGTRVPMEFVKNGEIVLNISFTATSGLKMENDLIRFSARFGGISRDIEVPVDNVVAIYARENGQGMAFEVGGKVLEEEGEEEAGDADFDEPSASSAPTLASVPTLAAIEKNDENDGGDDDPAPPRKGGRPALKRVK